MNFNRGDFVVIRKNKKNYDINGEVIDETNIYSGAVYEVLMQSEPMIALKCVFSENGRYEGACLSLHESEYEELINVPENYVKQLTTNSIPKPKVESELNGVYFGYQESKTPR